ncbi:hypothetical protein GQ651_16345 [Alphaproteobacteria bacterium GH1-50]|uniref:DUF2975 domain-containing protein n=1 Tax=Kangsaoukella pontilimi TaxID=2691042 RepID=A0A7C9N2J8_9RHOB|nr:hypothetical protein [Kangsaoukella pontilimi]MXQ09418.1 hypothetical protein [Kangsaoukella pontilimi]
MNFENRLPRVLYAASWAALILLPVSLIWTAAAGGLSRSALMRALPDVPVTDALSDNAVLLALAPAAIGVAAMCFVLWQMQALFRLFSEGQALTMPAALRIRRIGLGLLVAGLAGPVLRPLQILILTSANPPGERMLALGIGSSDVGLLLAAGLLTVIGWAMADAAWVAEENRGFV